MKLVLPANEAQDIAYDEHEGFEKIQENIASHSRWSVGYDRIVRRKSDGRYFLVSYQVGATESQDECAFEHVDEVTLPEVVPIERTVVVYEVVDEAKP